MVRSVDRRRLVCALRLFERRRRFTVMDGLNTNIHNIALTAHISFSELAFFRLDFVASMKTAQPSLVSRLELVDGSNQGRLYAKKDSSFKLIYI